MQTARFFLLGEAAAFIVAALIHGGVLIDGYQHREAQIAETVLASALLLGLAISWIRPRATRAAAVAAQSFALLGTLVGIFTIIVGVGPRTAIDIVYHVAIVVVLAIGIMVARRGVSQPA